ncbi:MAG: Uma2 family endonuclease [Saprospiraceae bacterium]|nr:Uma2 family endonuclease [Saprospiraceae bacterium]
MKVTFEEYITSEQESEVRHEFDNGVLIPLEATSKRHNRIITNVLRKIEPSKLAEKGCEIYHENVITKVRENKKYVYPDVVITCDPTDQADEYVIKNPCVIMEVLSKSTAPYDKAGKFFKYLRIPSLQQYILVSQYAVAVEYYLKMENGEWVYRALDSLEDVLPIPSISVELKLADLYAAVVFEEN